MTTRWMRAPSNPATPDQHHCEPIAPQVHPTELVGSDLDRWNQHPCIGFEPSATQCDMPQTESILRTLTVEAGAELVRYLGNLLEREPMRSRAGWEAHWLLLEAVRTDLMSKPRVAAILDDWEAEDADRRKERLKRAHHDATQEAKSMAQSTAPDPNRPLPEPEGLIG